MFCPKCGTENEGDANYCEGCGQSLQNGINKRNTIKTKNNGMSRGIKALIVLCVVLVVGIGVTEGMLLQKSSGSALATQINATNNSTNATNATSNITTTGAKVNSTAKKSKYITPSQALAIANKFALQYNETVVGPNNIGLINGHIDQYGNPCYHVYCKPISGPEYDAQFGSVFVDAVNGKIVS